MLIRVNDALDNVISTLGPGQTAFVFSSGGVIAALAACLIGVPEDDVSGQPLADPAVTHGCTTASP